MAARRQGKARGFGGTAGKIVACALVGTCLAAPAVFVNTVIGYIPLIAYLLVLLLSYLYVRVLSAHLSFEGTGELSECVRTEDIAFKLTVENTSFLPAVRIRALFYMSDIFGGVGATDAHYITLGPRQKKTFDFGVRFDHIGTYRVGISEVTALDVFGIFSSRKENDRLTEVSVQPKLFEIASVAMSKDASVEAKRQFSSVISDGMDYSGVREYRWGDPIKTVHWKLSARMPDGEYYTRLYETNANPGMAIIADFDAPGYTVGELMGIYDAVVECSFSLERFAALNGFDAELVFEDRAKRRRHYTTPFEGRRREILERMPQIFSPGTGRDALAIIRDEQNSYFGQSNLIVCTSVLSEELAHALVSAKVGKRVPILFAIVPKTIDEELANVLRKRLERLGAAGIPYTVLSSVDELEGE